MITVSASDRIAELVAGFPVQVLTLGFATELTEFRVRYLSKRICSACYTLDVNKMRMRQSDDHLGGCRDEANIEPADEKDND